MHCTPTSTTVTAARGRGPVAPEVDAVDAMKAKVAAMQEKLAEEVPRDGGCARKLGVPRL